MPRAVNAPHFHPREKCGLEHTGHNLWGRDLLVVQWQWKGEAGEAEGKKENAWGHELQIKVLANLRLRKYLFFALQ